jgi:hypothetical protein
MLNARQAHREVSSPHEFGYNQATNLDVTPDARDRHVVERIEIESNKGSQAKCLASWRGETNHANPNAYGNGDDGSFMTSASAQTELKTYADAHGYLNVQALTCAQLAGTFQDDADFADDLV